MYKLSITWLLYWKLPIDTYFTHFICRFHQFCGINTRECFVLLAIHQGMLGYLILRWAASFWLQWTMAEDTVHGVSSRISFYDSRSSTLVYDPRFFLFPWHSSDVFLARYVLLYPIRSLITLVERLPQQSAWRNISTCRSSMKWQRA